MTLKMPETTQKGITKTAAWRTAKVFFALWEKFISLFLWKMIFRVDLRRRLKLDELPSTFQDKFVWLLNDSRWEEFFKRQTRPLDSLETSRTFFSMKTLNECNMNDIVGGQGRLNSSFIDATWGKTCNQSEKRIFWVAIYFDVAVVVQCRSGCAQSKRSVIWIACGKKKRAKCFE